MRQVQGVHSIWSWPKAFKAVNRPGGRATTSELRAIQPNLLPIPPLSFKRMNPPSPNPGKVARASHRCSRKAV